MCVFVAACRLHRSTANKLIKSALQREGVHSRARPLSISTLSFLAPFLHHSSAQKKEEGVGSSLTLLLCLFVYLMGNALAQRSTGTRCSQAFNCSLPPPPPSSSFSSSFSSYYPIDFFILVYTQCGYQAQ